jgi:GNAT superfamily N-acetyltransferase
MNIEFTAVGRDNWDEFESFFERRGGPHYCWCMLWRPDGKPDAVSKKQQKKAAMKSRIKADEPVGILAYIDGEAVAWCSVAPRESYRSLGGVEDLENVWSLVCFFVRRDFRKQGLPRKLLDAAADYARNMGACYLEAYPVKADSPSYRFMGTTTMFEQANFRFMTMAGTRRHVMLLEL